MSFRIHLIHDLDYGFNEPTEPVDLELPDCDVVIMNGNLAEHGKRSMFYAYELCIKYPDIQFVYNEGYKERYRGVVDKCDYEYENSISTRLQHDGWPSNLHWKDPRSPDALEFTLQTGQTISVWPAFGFPDIIQYDCKWEDTWFYRNICEGQIPVYKLDSDLLPETDIKIFGDIDKWATEEFIKQKFIEQENMIRQWETSLQHYGILVTHLSPHKDPRLEGLSYKGYNIHLHNRVWATTAIKSKVNYVGAELESNPGRGSGPRGKVLEVD
tara:strand:- start:3251 stop:4060 length:810 start_codon:yes stop_codon:yes gene_type:complete